LSRPAWSHYYPPLSKAPQEARLKESVATRAAVLARRHSREGVVAETQSSFGLGVRSLIAIGSLIAVPAIAVVGVSAPQALHRAKHAYKPVVAATEGETAPGESSQADQALVADASDAARRRDPGSGLPAADRSTGGMHRPPARPAAAFWAANASTAAPDHQPESLHRQTAITASTVSTGETRPAESVTRQTAYEAEVPHRLQPTTRRLEHDPSPDRFTALERRLRDLGATHYRLETWGDEGELFRFRCMMAVPGRANHNRYFEATDPEALRSMERVLRQVERWHAGL
jgi:hypothetical protein